MLVWFVVLGAMGFAWIMRNPSVLQAFNPFLCPGGLRDRRMVNSKPDGCGDPCGDGRRGSLRRHGAFWAEGDFAGLACRGPARARCSIISRQAALAVHNPVLYQSDADPFFHGSAGVADAGLGGAGHHGDGDRVAGADFRVFSLTAQAQQLHFLPKFLVIHTSRHERGRVYVPTTNWLLCFACLLLVLDIPGERESCRSLWSRGRWHHAYHGDRDWNGNVEVLGMVMGESGRADHGASCDRGAILSSRA